VRKYKSKKKKNPCGKFPTLKDYKKHIPKGGLQGPSLRKGKTAVSDVARMNPLEKPNGNFKNIGM